MTVYRYLETKDPDGKRALFALHDETISSRAQQIVSANGGGYDIETARADAEGEAIVKAVAVLDGPGAEWWAHGWEASIHSLDPHVNIINRCGGWDAVRWQQSMPALP